MLHIHAADLRAALQTAATACYLSPLHSWTGDGHSRRRPTARFVVLRSAIPSRRPFSASIEASTAAIGGGAGALSSVEKGKKPEICTADELHYVPVPGTDWKIALWRYLPSNEAPKRNHPLMLLSGVGTNAIGFDLSPGASFARHMSKQGFDTWIVEVRGAGLSMRTHKSNETIQSSDKPAISNLDSTDEVNLTGYLSVEGLSAVNISPEVGAKISKVNGDKGELVSVDESQLVTKLTSTFMNLAERLSGYLNEGQLRAISEKFLEQISKLLEDAGLAERFNEIAAKISSLLEARQNSAVAGQLRELSQRLINTIEEGQKSVSPQLFDLQERLSSTIEDFQKQLDLIVTYDWDFDNYLEEDLPAAMEYIREHSMVKDSKLLTIGHSMGGILLYALLSRCAAQGSRCGLAAIVTLAASVDYTTSKSSLKLLLPLVSGIKSCIDTDRKLPSMDELTPAKCVVQADPAQALNVPVVPLGALMTAAYPLSSRPPYVLSWITSQVSAQDMMLPELYEKLVLNNFCTIPAKVILQLTSAFREGGLRNRTGNFSYKDNLHKCDVPVLALAGDQDLICPPEAVYETVKLIPKSKVSYKVFGKPDGPHYAHYDLVGGRLATNEVYPCIINFLCCHDELTCEHSD
ncbi:hypothetical protein IEQ34_004395 [Dendrobium chrysotoxum]|uniref:AB hydrolase-1 domain-containing protein n=1 Tax=Dendrobium chrysotoxum TaxID=161865 RepID=A0AAV7HE68_DENCH|nr:hypothetical protein IEQ34_004395 [Dendrobium chrysotoxum]